MIQPTYENIVKNWFNFTFNKVFNCALILLILVISFGVITENALLMKTAKPLYIPVFLIFFFVKHSHLGIAFISFLIFSFFGDTASMFFLEDSLIEASSVLYIISYIYLLIMVIPHLKILEIKPLIGTYLLVVFAISVYFLYVIYNLMLAVIPNPNEVLLFGIKNLVLIILGFVSFAVYLNTQTKQSVLFLTAIIFFGLSSILNYINLYYLYNWSFELLHSILYVLAIFMMFKYIMSLNFKKSTKQLQLNKREKYTSDVTVLS